MTKNNHIVEFQWSGHFLSSPTIDRCAALFPMLADPFLACLNRQVLLCKNDHDLTIAFVILHSTVSASPILTAFVGLLVSKLN
jgi:hypothetical protein